jgi:hypothetical protein
LQQQKLGHRDLLQTIQQFKSQMQQMDDRASVLSSPVANAFQLRQLSSAILKEEHSADLQHLLQDVQLVRVGIGHSAHASRAAVKSDVRKRGERWQLLTAGMLSPVLLTALH